MFAQVVVLQTQLIEDDGGPVGPEAAAVQPDVEQPVIVVVGFLGGCVEEKPAFGVVTFQAHLGFQPTDLIEADDLHRRMIEGQERQAVHEVDELLRWIMPEDDPLPCIDEEFGQRVIESVWCPWAGTPLPDACRTRSNPSLSVTALVCLVTNRA